MSSATAAARADGMGIAGADGGTSDSAAVAAAGASCGDSPPVVTFRGPSPRGPRGAPTPAHPPGEAPRASGLDRSMTPTPAPEQSVRFPLPTCRAHTSTGLLWSAFSKSARRGMPCCSHPQMACMLHLAFFKNPFPLPSFLLVKEPASHCHCVIFFPAFAA